MKKITLAASAILGILSSPVWAQTEVTFTGSTALRSPTQQGILSLLNNGKFQGDNVDFKRANSGIWTGKFGGKNFRIKIAWSGSTAGIQNNAGSIAIKFPDNSTPTVNPNTTGAKFDSRVPDINIADSFQASTPFNGTVGGVTYARLKAEIVAVQVFQWLGSKNFPGNNLTNLTAQQLYTTGRIPLSLVTGKNADRNVSVFALGRNPGSGTRTVGLSESGIGSSTVIKQWQPSITNQVDNGAGTLVGGKVTNHILWPIETIDGASTRFQGNSGFSSGSGVATTLTANLTKGAFKIGNSKATAGYYIGYVGLSDAPTAVNSGAKSLSWNGVNFTTKNVTEGAYSFWSYAFVMFRPDLDGEQLSFAEALVKQIKTVEVDTISTLISVDRMQVRRTIDGGPIVPRFN